LEMHSDPSNIHSEGWFLLDSKDSDPRLAPNYNALPPTKDECEGLSKGIARIKRFYEEGASKQESQKEQIKFEKNHFQLHNKRIEAQLQALQRHPADHITRRRLEAELKSEQLMIKSEISKRDTAEKNLKIIYEKREDIVKTMGFLENLVKQHCGKYK